MIVNNELRRIWKDIVVVYLRYYPRMFWRKQKINKSQKTSTKIAGLLKRIKPIAVGVQTIYPRLSAHFHRKLP
jgi:hypothetical protein